MEKRIASYLVIAVLIGFVVLFTCVFGLGGFIIAMVLLIPVIGSS